MTLIQTLTEKLSSESTVNAQYFVAHGIPTPKVEKWHYTNLGALSRTPWAFNKADNASQQSCDKTDIRIFDGHATIATLPEGINVLSRYDAEQLPAIKNMLTREFADKADSLAALAHSQSSPLFLHVTKQVEGTVTLENFAMLKESVNFPHLCIVLDKGASLTLNSTSESASAAWCNPLTQIHVSEEAELTLMHLQNERGETIHTSHTFISADARSKLNLYGMNVGGATARQTFDLDLNGEEIETKVAIVNLADGKQAQDFTVHINHNAPGCPTEVISRNVCRGRGQSVFQGKFYVAQIAQQTDAEMSCKSLLLSDRARADSKPELEIYADDVKCGHGATVGTLDQDSLFYLTSRGVPRTAAENLLVAGFTQDVLELIPDEHTQHTWQQHFANWLKSSSESAE